MATRPTTTPEWATDPNYPAGSDPWSETPTRVEPDTGDQETGFIPGRRPPAQWFNWLFGLVSDWVDYFAAIIDSDEEHTYQTPKTRIDRLPIWSGQGGTFTFDGQKWVATDGSSQLRQPITIPTGATLVRIFAIVNPDNAGLIKVGLEKHVFGGAYSTITRTTTYGATAPAVAGRQLVEYVVGGGGHVVDRAIHSLAANVDAGAANDQVEGIFIEWLDIGPRSGG